MRPPSTIPDNNLSALDDVQLVRLARDAPGGPAVWTLVFRHLDWASGLLIRQARRHGLHRADPEEARQEAVFGIVRTAAVYRLPSAGQAGTPFRALLVRVLIHDLQDSARRARRAARLFVRGLPSARCLIDSRDGPVCTAERQELLGSLHAELDAQGGDFRQLWEQKEAGGSLRAFALERHLSDDRVERQWQQGVKRLWRRLHCYFEGTA
jgi:hypothetical protein